MTIYKMPPQEPPSEEGKAKEPEIIIVENSDEPYDNFSHTIHPQQPSKAKLGFRILALIVGACAAIWTAFLLCLFALLAVIGAFFLYRNPQINQSISTMWVFVRVAAALSTGLLIAVFSPTLGLMLILAYIVSLDENWRHSAMMRTLRSRVETYMD